MQVNDGNWHHVVAIFSRTQDILLYRDNVSYPVSSTPSASVEVACDMHLLVARSRM